MRWKENSLHDVENSKPPVNLRLDGKLQATLVTTCGFPVHLGNPVMLGTRLFFDGRMETGCLEARGRNTADASVTNSGINCINKRKWE